MTDGTLGRCVAAAAAAAAMAVAAQPAFSIMRPGAESMITKMISFLQ